MSNQPEARCGNCGHGMARHSWQRDHDECEDCRGRDNPCTEFKRLTATPAPPAGSGVRRIWIDLVTGAMCDHKLSDRYELFVNAGPPTADSRELAEQTVGTVFRNTSASHETLERVMVDRIAALLDQRGPALDANRLQETIRQWRESRHHDHLSAEDDEDLTLLLVGTLDQRGQRRANPLLESDCCRAAVWVSAGGKSNCMDCEQPCGAYQEPGGGGD